MRIVLGTHAPFFHDDLELWRKLFCIQLEIRHAVSFQFHHLGQSAFRYLLEVGGVIEAGKGIVAPASRCDTPGKFTRTDLFGTLEHHVFEHVSKAGSAIHLVDGTGTIPNHLHHGWCAMIFLDDDVQAIGQGLFVGIGENGGTAQQHRQQQGAA